MTDTIRLEDGVDLAVRRRPGAGPAVVLAHGITGHGGTWASFVDALPVDWDVSACDARGHGASGHTAHYSYAALATDLARVVQGLGLRRPALVGHSMGAHTVALAAAAAPGLARCIVLEDPPWRQQDRPLAAQRRRAEAWRRELEQIAAGSVEARVDTLRQLRPAWTDDDRRRCAQAERILDPHVTDVLVGGESGWRSAVGDLRCPALLVCGDTQAEAIVTPEVADEASALHAGLRVVRLDGAGHNVRRDRPDAYARAVIGFLREHAESPRA